MSNDVPVDRPTTPGKVARGDLAQILASRHLPGLDGLRAVAVLVVMIYHFGYQVPGDLGVTSFFVLSGFLITWLLLRERKETGRVSLASFYMRRTLRIFPAYYAFILLSIIADQILDDPWTAGQIAAALGYVVNYYQAFNGHDAPASHTWSLAVEEQFYLLWPVVFIWLVARGPKAMTKGLVAAIAAVMLWRSWLIWGMNAPDHYLYNAFDTRLDSLAIGCLMAVLLASPQVVAGARHLMAHPALPLVTIGLLLWSRIGGPASYHYAFGFTVDSLLVAILLVQLMQGGSTALWGWLNWKWVRYLGAISYPMYLWHGWAITVGKKLVFLPEVARFGAGVATTIALAAGSYHLLERPFLALRPRLEARLRQSASGR